MMPILPFISPKNALEMSSVVRDCENPNTREKTMVNVRPRRIAYLRPIRSENVPQGTAMMHWQPATTAEERPTHFAISFLGTPMLSIISGWWTIRDIHIAICREGIPDMVEPMYRPLLFFVRPFSYDVCIFTYQVLQSDILLVTRLIC